MTSPSKPDGSAEKMEHRPLPGLPPDANGRAASSPTRTVAPASNGALMTANAIRAPTDTLSKVDAAQVRDLREAFQLLDRDGDGIVGRDDVAVTLNDLGMTSRRCYVAISDPLATDISPKRPGRVAAHHLGLLSSGKAAERNAGPVPDPAVCLAGQHVEAR